jgi:hypothetical protein
MNGLITDLSKSNAEELFEIVTINGQWKLKLKDGVSLDYEEDTSFSISIGIKSVPNSRGTINPATPITIDVTVVNVNELAQIQISGPDLSIIDIGDELTVKVVKEDDDGLHATPNIAYKWFYASDPDTFIGTGTSYYITAADHGKKIGVERTYTDINGNQDKVVKMMDANIILTDADKARFIITNKQGIGEAPKVGTVLTALRVSDDPDGHRPGSTTFEWYHVGNPDEVIGRGNIYTVVEGDIGFQIRFRAIYTDGNGQIETINANIGSITGIVVAADETGNNGDEGDAKFFISNENQVREAPTIGTVLTALRGKADPDGNGNGPIDIQWFHINAPEVVIGTKNTYTVTTDDVGHRLMFRAFYIDGDGKIESVLANAPSISGVVTAPTGTTNTLLASSTTTSITENEDGFITSLTLRVQDSANQFLTLEKDKFIITMNNRISDLGKSNAAEMFEVINDNGVWKLKLKDGYSFNFEKDTSFSISITVNNIANSAGVVVPSNTITITITIANANEFADIQIVAPDPSEIDIGDKLTVNIIAEDEDGLHATPSISFKWFYASDPDTVIGTGDSYIVKAADRGEKIGLERTYTDIYGNQDKVVDILDVEVLRVEITTPTPPVSPSPSAPPQPVDTTVTVEPETASKVKAGDGSDTITDGNRNDIIIGGKGDDVIDLGHDEEGKDQDQVVYGIGDQSAKDGGDTITNFNRGRDSFIFSLEANSDTNAIDSLDDFLDYVIGSTPNDLSDDQLLVGLNFNFNSLGSVELTGISFHFHDSVSFGGGRVAIPIVTVHFSEALDQQAIINALGGDLQTALTSFNSDGILTNIDYLDDLMGGVGSIGYQIDTL